jgi:hypothetical protein
MNKFEICPFAFPQYGSQVLIARLDTPQMRVNWLRIANQTVLKFSEMAKFKLALFLSLFDLAHRPNIICLDPGEEALNMHQKLVIRLKPKDYLG